MSIVGKLTLGALALAVISAGAAGTYWLFQTCQPLDRLFGVSGCTQSIRIANVMPLEGPTMSAADADGMASLFGRSPAEWDAPPVMVRIDIEAGLEVQRYRLPHLNGIELVMAFADDGERAHMKCYGSQDCMETGWRGAILDLNDARVLEGRDDQEYWDERYRSAEFPGDPRPERQDNRAGFWAAGGERIVRVDREENILLQKADGSPFAMLLNGDQRWTTGLGRYPTGLTISPSGERIALFDPNRESGRTYLHVWDAMTGDLLIRYHLPGYAWRAEPAWTLDETRIALFRTDGEHTLIHLYGL